MVLPRQSASLCLVALEILAGQQLAQEHRLAPGVGQFDADGVPARHHRDAGRDRAHRAGDVVGQRDHAGGLGARRRLELVERHDRAGADLDDLAAYAEILQHAFEQAGVLLEHLDRQLLILRRRRLGQELDRRQLEAGILHDGQFDEAELCPERGDLGPRPRPARDERARADAGRVTAWPTARLGFDHGRMLRAQRTPDLAATWSCERALVLDDRREPGLPGRRRELEAHLIALAPAEAGPGRAQRPEPSARSAQLRAIATVRLFARRR